MDPPAPIPEVPPVEKLLQRLVTEAVVSPPASAGTRTDAAVVPVWTAADEAAPLDCGPSDGIGTMWCVSHVESRVMLRLVARTWMNLFCLCSRDGGQRRLRGGGVHYDPTSGVARPTADGKRRLIRGEGVRLPGQWYCSTPGSWGRGNACCCSPTDED